MHNSQSTQIALQRSRKKKRKGGGFGPANIFQQSEIKMQSPGPPSVLLPSSRSRRNERTLNAGPASHSASYSIYTIRMSLQLAPSVAAACAFYMHEKRPLKHRQEKDRKDKTKAIHNYAEARYELAIENTHFEHNNSAPWSQLKAHRLALSYRKYCR